MVDMAVVNQSLPVQNHREQGILPHGRHTDHKSRISKEDILIFYLNQSASALIRDLCAEGVDD